MKRQPDAEDRKAIKGTTPTCPSSDPMKSQYFIHSQKRQADDGLHDNDFRTEIKQAAFEPNNLVPGIGSSRRGSLLACLLFYTGAYRARMGVNYTQIPVRARTGSWRSTI